MSDPRGTVKQRVQTFPRYFRHWLVSKQGTSIKCICLGLLWIDSAICSRATSAAAGAGVQMPRELWCPFTNQSSGVKTNGFPGAMTEPNLVTKALAYPGHLGVARQNS